jgi:hypothetical protein
MISPITAAFAGGAIAAGYTIAGVFFLRFWRRTGDVLFLSFAVAFWLMAANQVVPIALGSPRETKGGAYLLRLAAFALIIIAILGKNMFSRSRRP